MPEKAGLCEVIEDYKSKQAQYDEKKAAFDQVNQQRDDKRMELDQLRDERLTKFMTGFEIISMKLKEMYQIGWPPSEVRSLKRCE